MAALDETDQAADLRRAEQLAVEQSAALLESMYALARGYACLGRRDPCYRWLERLVAAGFADAARLDRDEAFAPYRHEHRYGVLSRWAWANGCIAGLEHADRARCQRLDLVLAALAVRQGERVADVGAGTGFFTIPLAREVGPAGLVWAIDVVPELLEHLVRRLRLEQIENVQPVRGALDDPRLLPGEAQTILLADTLHCVREPTTFLRRLRTGLASGGRVAVIEHAPRPGAERPWSPPPGRPFPREAADAAMAQAGLLPAEAFDFLPEQYFVVYRAA